MLVLEMRNFKRCFPFSLNIISIFLASATRSAGQAPIATDNVCLRLQNVSDNLSGPPSLESDGLLRCYSQNELCNQVQFCSTGSDEGNNVVALDCKFLKPNVILL